MLIIGAKTDIGKRRPNNEDTFYANEEKGLFIIADGMGGHQSGEVASRMAIEEIKGYLESFDSDITHEVIEKAVEEANKAIYLKSMESRTLHGMGSTVVVAVIRDGWLLLAHVGDSRAYFPTDEGMKRLTNDHSLIFKLMEEGKISEEEARVHPKRGVILRALGVEKFVDVDVRKQPYNGETLLLCTDGLTDMLRDDEIEEILLSTSNPKQACELLVERANEAGGKDNITVMVVKG